MGRPKKTIEEKKESNRIRQKRFREKNEALLGYYQQRNLKSWVERGVIPQETNCQICKKKIYFNNKEQKEKIHFDHKTIYVPIEISPTEWLRRNMCTDKNKVIWAMCNFGMLCKCCNAFLPTMNRETFIKKVTKYINKK